RAVLSGGNNPTGSFVCARSAPNGFAYTQTDAVSGDGTYTASTTLPTTGTVIGTYTWTATYSGDGNNAAANDQGGPTEQTVVGPRSEERRVGESASVRLPPRRPATGTRME